jgi:hypothetical protein
LPGTQPFRHKPKIEIGPAKMDFKTIDLLSPESMSLLREIKDAG